MNSLLENSIINVIDSYSSLFINKENVVGLGLGYKVINNFITKEPTLHVLVEKKIPKNQLYKQDIIPNNFLGVKTDVIEIGLISPNFWSSLKNAFTDKSSSTKPQSQSDINRNTIKILNRKMRPVQPGCAIFSDYLRTGTLGCIVFDNSLENTAYFLTSGDLSPKNFIFQPPFEDFLYLRRNTFLGMSFKYIELNAMKSESDTTYNISNAIISPIRLPYKKEIFGIGIVNETSTPILNETIYKVGAGTGSTSGIIESTNVTISLIIDKNKYLFKKQILSSLLSKNSDSGSLVFNKEKKAIGMLMGSSLNSTIINPIEEILNYFNVHL